MNEAETRAELIDTALTQAGWGVVEISKIFREYNITAGKIQTGGRVGILDTIFQDKQMVISILEHTTGRQNNTCLKGDAIHA